MKTNHAITKINKRIEIVSTDTRTMKETGFGSLKTCRIIRDILQQHYTDVSFREAHNKGDLEDIVKRRPDLVVLCVKYICDPNKINLAAFFEKQNIAHTGSDEVTLEYDSNKGKAKTLLLEHGIATAKFFLTQPKAVKNELQLPLPLPLFVKPLNAANGNGVDENSIVHDWLSYTQKVEEIFNQYGESSIVEEILPGREFTVAVLEDLSTNTRYAYPVEIIAHKNSKGDRVLGSFEKSSNQERVLAVESAVSDSVSELAKKVFSILRVKDFGRIDIKMDAKGIPHFIEANLVPGLTPETSYFPRSCNMEKAMPYDTLVLNIIDFALQRNSQHTCREQRRESLPFADLKPAI
ncbi:MAG: D-alanine--D-alanine ligase [Methylocystaceae bacterium]|nr:D-alanine--D-alanine ligase [Methylocystaceae bacterium]